MSAYLYVDGLGTSVSLEALITLLAGSGTVLPIELFPQVYEESLQMAKVQMGSAREADAAVQVINNTTLNGSLLTVLKTSEFNATRQVRDTRAIAPLRVNSLTCGLLNGLCFRSA